MALNDDTKCTMLNANVALRKIKADEGHHVFVQFTFVAQVNNKNFASD